MVIWPIYVRLDVIKALLTIFGYNHIMKLILRIVRGPPTEEIIAELRENVYIRSFWALKSRIIPYFMAWCN